MSLSIATMIWLSAAVQVSGLLLAWIVRWNECARAQTTWQHLFMACLGCAGVATAMSALLGPGWLLASGGGLAMMVLSAICEFGGNGK